MHRLSNRWVITWMHLKVNSEPIIHVCESFLARPITTLIPSFLCTAFDCKHVEVKTPFRVLARMHDRHQLVLLGPWNYDVSLKKTEANTAPARKERPYGSPSKVRAVESHCLHCRSVPCLWVAAATMTMFPAGDLESPKRSCWMRKVDQSHHRQSLCFL